MSKEISEESKFNISLKTLGAIAVGIATLVGFYYKLHSEIEEAKSLPRIGTGVYSIDASDANAKETYPPTRGEFSMKDQMSRQILLQLQKEIQAAKTRIEKIEEKLMIIELRNRR